MIFNVILSQTKLSPVRKRLAIFSAICPTFRARTIWRTAPSSGCVRHEAAASSTTSFAVRVSCGVIEYYAVLCLRPATSFCDVCLFLFYLASSCASECPRRSPRRRLHGWCPPPHSYPILRFSCPAPPSPPESRSREECSIFCSCFRNKITVCRATSM